MAAGGQIRCTNASTLKQMHDTTTDHISNSVWAARRFCVAAHWRSCLAATLSFVTVHSCPAQGGGEALITHLQSAANYCLPTGTDEPVATTTERWRGWGWQKHLGGGRFGVKGNHASETYSLMSRAEERQSKTKDRPT